MTLILLITKVVLSAGMVITVTLVAEKVSPRFAGVLLGFPLGSGLTFFFTGIEQGSDFVSQGAIWTIQGLSGTLVFCFFYNLGQQFLRVKGLLSLFMAVLLGLAGFFSTAILYNKVLGNEPFFRWCIVAIIFLGAAVWFRRWPSKIVKRKVLSTLSVIMARAMFAAVIIIAITAVASKVGHKWTGLFAAFPTTLLPSVLVLHYHYGGDIVQSIFREIPFGLIAIVVFSISVQFFYPACGVYTGTIVSYGIAGCYLFLYEVFLKSVFDKLLGKKLVLF